MISFGGQESKTSSVPTQLSMYDPSQQALMKQLYGVISGGVSGPVPAYPKEMYVPKLPEEETFLKTLGTLPGQMPGRQAALEQTLSGKVPYDIGPEWAQKYFEEALRPMYEREWSEKTLPTIREAYTGPGYWGSARAEAIGEGREKLGETMAGTKAGLTYSEELAKRIAMEAALGRQAAAAPAAYEKGLADIGTAGAYARAIQEQQVLADYQRWLSGETVNGIAPTQYNPFLQMAFQYMGLRPFTYGTTTTSEAGGSSTGFNLLGLGSLAAGAGSLLGGGAAAAEGVTAGLGGYEALAAAMSIAPVFSDRLTKDNIKPIDASGLELIRELNPITFDYKPGFGSKDQIGFVADEVEKIIPEAVITGEDGYKRILPWVIIPVLVKAIQEQQLQLNELDSRIKE